MRRLGGLVRLRPQNAERRTQNAERVHVTKCQGQPARPRAASARGKQGPALWQLRTSSVGTYNRRVARQVQKTGKDSKMTEEIAEDLAEAQGNILVRVAPVDSVGRKISRPDVAQALQDRARDIINGVKAGTSAIANSLSELASPDGWSIQKVDAVFGITLAAEGSVIVSKASAEASFEVTVSFERRIGVPEIA